MPFIILKALKYINAMKSDNFKNVKSFVRASIAASVGLGNVLRFPGLCAKFGGGAFLLVYGAATFILGVPLLCTEIALGRKYRSLAPKTFENLRKGGNLLGWAAVSNSLTVAIFYAAIIGWILSMAVGIIPLALSQNTLSSAQIAGWFFNNVLKSGESYLKSFSPMPLLFTVIGWVIIYFCVKGGASALSKISKYTLLIPIITLSVIAVRGLLYKNGIQALAALFTPDFSALLNVELWVAALGQAFFSLSVLVGVMPAYGCYAPQNLPVFSSALTIAIADFAVATLAAIALFTTAYGAGLTDLIQPSGIATAFCLYPVAIVSIFPNYPVISGVFGGIFYLSLLLIALQSTLSLAQAFIGALQDKFNLSRKRAQLFTFIPAAIISFFFCSNVGVLLVEICDTFANGYNLLLLGVLECFTLISYGNFGGICNGINKNCAHLKMPKKAFTFSLKYLCPAVLIFLSAACIVNAVTRPNVYPLWAQLVFGVGASVLVFLSGVLLNVPKRVIAVRPLKRKKVR